MTRRFPAEWEKHQATLLSFPAEGRDWPGKYHAIKWAFVEMIKKVTNYEPVILVVKSEELRDKVVVMLEQAHVDQSAVSYIIKDTNRNWMRDSGPAIVMTTNGDREAIQFGFTGWAKYQNHRKDQGIPAAVAHHLGLPVTQAIYNNKLVVLEGGSIDMNGCGTLITTEECLMDPVQQVRNKGFRKEDYENVFREYFGVTNTIWLGEGIEGDDTHGHVDDICRFVNPNTVVAAQESNISDPNHKKTRSQSGNTPKCQTRKRRKTECNYNANAWPSRFRRFATSGQLCEFPDDQWLRADANLQRQKRLYGTWNPDRFIS